MGPKKFNNTEENNTTYRGTGNKWFFTRFPKDFLRGFGAATVPNEFEDDKLKQKLQTL